MPATTVATRRFKLAQPILLHSDSDFGKLFSGRLPFERKSIENLIVVQRAHGACLVCKLRLGEIQQFFVESKMNDGVGLQGTV